MNPVRRDDVETHHRVVVEHRFQHGAGQPDRESRHDEAYCEVQADVRLSIQSVAEESLESLESLEDFRVQIGLVRT